MTITEILNKGAGAIVGIFTGLLIPFCQVPMAYYLFAQNMRAINPDQSWLTIILLTSTLGSIHALIVACAAIIHSPWSVMYGIKEGLQEGVKGAVILPYAIFGRIAEDAKTETPTPDQWRTSPVSYVFDTLFHSLWVGSFSFVKMFIKPCITDPMDRRHQEKMAAIKKMYSEKIDLLKTIDAQQVDLKSAIEKLMHVESKKDPAQEESATRMILNSKMQQGVIDFTKSELLKNDPENTFILAAANNTTEAKLFLKDICSAIAAMTKDEQDIVIQKLAVSANKYVLLRANLDHLKIIMEPKTPAMFTTNNGMVFSIIERTLAVVDKLKPDSNLSATPPAVIK